MEEALARTFVTPIDREDLQKLSSELDDILDRTNGAIRAAVLYGVEKLTEPMGKLMRVPNLCKNAYAKVTEGTHALRKLEKDGYAIFRESPSAGAAANMEVTARWPPHRVSGGGRGSELGVLARHPGHGHWTMGDDVDPPQVGRASNDGGGFVHPVMQHLPCSVSPAGHVPASVGGLHAGRPPQLHGCTQYWVAEQVLVPQANGPSAATMPPSAAASGRGPEPTRVARRAVALACTAH